MLSKLRLDQTKKYEQAIATYEIAKMIVAFVEGRKHHLSIGAEQGDIKGWDDFIIEEAEKSRIHIQVKRQQTDFLPSGSCINQNNDKKLTPLDNSMKELALWIKGNDSNSSLIKRHFRLEIPSDGLNIKNELGLRNLRDFKTLHITSTTTIEGIKNLHDVQKDSVAINIFHWLNQWCDFKDWNHILKALKILEICDSGIENDIDKRTMTEISRIFRDAEDVLRLIKLYTNENSSYTGVIAPRQLLFELQDYLLPTIRTWSQAENDNNSWKISGIHDLENNSEIERPSVVVPLLWSNERQRNLKINTTSINHELSKPHQEVFQLALHLSGNSSALCVNWPAWKECLHSKVGGTLGTSNDDFENLSISDDTAPFDVIDTNVLNTISKQERFASQLSDEMIKTTWNLTANKVSGIISEMNCSSCSELRDAVEIRWKEWKRTLGANVSEQRMLFETMLHPSAEGKEIHGELRIGTKTVNLIADGMYLLLLVSTALTDDSQDWKKDGNGLSIKVLSLKYWSGPSGEKRKVREIDDGKIVNELIGKESADILIISKSRFSESYIYKELLANNDGLKNSLASPHRPKLLVTKNPGIEQFIDSGELKPFQEFLLRDIIESKTEPGRTVIKDVTL